MRFRLIAPLMAVVALAVPASALANHVVKNSPSANCTVASIAYAGFSPSNGPVHESFLINGVEVSHSDYPVTQSSWTSSLNYTPPAESFTVEIKTRWDHGSDSTNPTDVTIPVSGCTPPTPPTPPAPPTPPTPPSPPVTPTCPPNLPNGTYPNCTPDTPPVVPPTPAPPVAPTPTPVPSPAPTPAPKHHKKHHHKKHHKKVHHKKSHHPRKHHNHGFTG